MLYQLSYTRVAVIQANRALTFALATMVLYTKLYTAIYRQRESPLSGASLVQLVPRNPHLK